MKAKATYSVVLPKDKRPGLLSCGDLVPGKAYEFPPEEAVRLVDAKGFEFGRMDGDKFIGNASAEKAAREDVRVAEEAAVKAAAKAAKESGDALIDAPTEMPPPAAKSQE